MTKPKRKFRLGPEINADGVILAPNGRPAREPFAGHIVGPSGRPAIIDLVAKRNTENRARLRHQLGNWQPHFPIDSRMELRQVIFAVREKTDDVMVLGPPYMPDGWWDHFRLGEIFPLKGYEFQVFDIYNNALHLRCRGLTGQARKGKR